MQLLSLVMVMVAYPKRFEGTYLGANTVVRLSSERHATVDVYLAGIPLIVNGVVSLSEDGTLTMDEDTAQRLGRRGVRILSIDPGSDAICLIARIPLLGSRAITLRAVGECAPPADADQI